MRFGKTKSFPRHWHHNRHFPEILAAELTAIAAEIRGGQDSAPILLRPICQALDITVVRRPSVEPGKAYLEWNHENGSPPLVLLPMVNILSWDRFCAAHELGHYALITHYKWNPDSESGYWQTEVLCDYFARELLLPDSLFTEAVGSDAAKALTLCNKISREADVPWIQTAKKMTQMDPGVFFLRIEPDRRGLIVKATSLPLEKGRRSSLSRRIPFFAIAHEAFATARERAGPVQLIVGREDFVGSKLGELFSELEVRSIAIEAYNQTGNVKLAALR